MRLYGDLAWVWSLFTDQETYEDEAQNLVEIALDALSRDEQAAISFLELGAGGGYLASALPQHWRLTLVDISNEMLIESQKINPKARHLQGDMCHLNLNEKFDVILVHDAVMYLKNLEAAQLMMQSIQQHLAPKGVAILIPDAIKESFYERSFLGGASGIHNDQMVDAQLTEWHWDPNPEDDQVMVEFSLLLRENGTVQSVHESHPMLVLSLAQWMTLFNEVGLYTEFSMVPWMGGGDFFLLKNQPAS